MPAAPVRIPPEVQERINDGAIGPYKIVSTIGAGGMGAVFRCRDGKLRREVAVKLLLAPSDGKNIERFLSEARTMARLSHPNVVQVYDVGYDGHVPFFVMELVEGESLATKLERLGRLPADETRDILIQIASGLAAVHKLGIIHRDVKAANVIEMADGVAKLLDFGISRPVEHAPQLTSTGLVMGTPSSMAPEQLRGEDLDARADVYALGVLAYQLLAGQRPYEGEDPTEIATKQDTPYVPLKTLRPDVPRDIENAIRRALAQKRDERYWNCEEMLKDLAPAGLRPGTIAHRGIGSGDVTHAARRDFGTLPWIAGACLAGVALAVGARSLSQVCLVGCAAVAGAEGRPPIEATPTGVFLWHDYRGWHLRAKSADAAREISGAIRVTGGTIESVRGIDEASADALTVDGRHAARFHYDDPGPSSGFDFEARSGCVELTVTSREELAASLVHVGAAGTTPAALPFRVCR